MLITPQERETLNSLFKRIKLKNAASQSGQDQTCKIEQIIAYLEIIHSNLRCYSKKRNLILYDSGAGNCYLSFLVYFYYTKIKQRPVVLHCIDHNEILMMNCRNRARELGFKQMHFHACDIADYSPSGKVTMVYSLHACDSATDKTLYFGARHGAATILSVSCCQHSIRKQLRSSRYSGITRHSVYKDKFVYMVGDSLRGLLLEMHGYKVSIFEFVSSRFTDKNIMLRAKKGCNGRMQEIEDEYERLKNEFGVKPELELYLCKGT